jgi:hypothetical protein
MASIQGDTLFFEHDEVERAARSPGLSPPAQLGENECRSVVQMLTTPGAKGVRALRLDDSALTDDRLARILSVTVAERVLRSADA